MSEGPIKISDGVTLNPGDFDFSFIRASGPGGQNVNKVSSAVQLRFDVSKAVTLPEAVKAKALAIAGKRATQAGVIVIEAKQYRHQARNKAAAVERLVEIFQTAVKPDIPRQKTRPTGASVRRRLLDKKQPGARKSLRRKPDLDD